MQIIELDLRADPPVIEAYWMGWRLIRNYRRLLAFDVTMLLWSIGWCALAYRDGMWWAVGIQGLLALSFVWNIHRVRTSLEEVSLLHKNITRVRDAMRRVG